jgi:hypothetical protein
MGRTGAGSIQRCPRDLSPPARPVLMSSRRAADNRAAQQPFIDHGGYLIDQTLIRETDG